MSEAAASGWSLPPLVLYPEREERPDGWTDRLESALTSWPRGIWPRLHSANPVRVVRSIDDAGIRFADSDDMALLEEAKLLRMILRREGFRYLPVARAFALVREIATRTLGLRHHDVQLCGGFALLKGRIAEMDTGEGKTLTATLAACTAALAGVPVHVVTVNDYLARRDAESMAPIYRGLGLRVGMVVHGMSPEQRRAAYACDVTYCSNKEVAFDYLRDRLALGGSVDNLRLKLERFRGRPRTGDGVVMRGLHFAIVDEADSVLVDEARTPLIISRETSAADERTWAEQAMALASSLEPDRHYRVLRDERRVELTESGRATLAEVGEREGGIWRSRIRCEEAARQAIAAHELFQRGEHYLVRDGRVQIVDEYTGRIMADRSWGEGLHQLVELKEGCAVTGRKLPIARITYQRFFRRYVRLAGMTGTAREAAREFWSVYRLPVTRIPTHLPLARQRLPQHVYPNAEEKWRAIVERTQALNDLGRPVLIGTRSVAASEIASQWLSSAGLEHVVLNAAQDSNEAEIIARAGQRGRITVATNMAGRGVDIRLGPGIADLGGLHVILTERHDARRIDRQLEGRCSRQGDPGSTEALLSLDDALFEFVERSWLKGLARMETRLAYWMRRMLVRLAQVRAERTHSRARRELLATDRKLGTLLAFGGGTE